MAGPWEEYAPQPESGPWSAYQSTPSKPSPPRDDSRLRGLALGVLKPIDNAARALESGVNALAGTNFQSATQASQANDAARAANTREGMQVVGNIVGTLPTLALPGGAAAQGAAAGALLSNEDTAGGVVQDAGLGALGGVVGDRLVRGAQAIIAPRVAPAIQRLKNAGVSMTPGQSARATGTRVGAAIGAIEDKAMSLPVVGDMIAADRVRGLEGFSIAAANQALRPIRAKVPDGLKPQDAVGYVQRATSAAYDRAARAMTAEIDAPFAQVIRQAREAMSDGTLAEPQAKQLEQILSSKLGRYFDPATGKVSGQQFASAFRSLRDLAARYSKSPDVSQQELGSVLGNVFEGLQDAAERHSGRGQADAFRRAREAYGNRVVIERAAAAAASASGREAGAFTPIQMISAIRQTDGTARKAATARGGGRMQQFATDASGALPSTVPNSGTADRIWQSNILGLGLGVAAAAPYAAAKGVNALVTLRPGPMAQRARNALSPLRPGATLAGPALMLRPED